MRWDGVEERRERFSCTKVWYNATPHQENQDDNEWATLPPTRQLNNAGRTKRKLSSLRDE